MKDIPAEAYEEFRINYTGPEPMKPWAELTEVEQLSWIEAHKVYINDGRPTRLHVTQHLP